jgi:hypothetical protein
MIGTAMHPTLPVGRFHELERQADRIIRGKLSGINAVSAQPVRASASISNPELSPVVVSAHQRLETTCWRADGRHRWIRAVDLCPGSGFRDEITLDDLGDDDIDERRESRTSTLMPDP